MTFIEMAQLYKAFDSYDNQYPRVIPKIERFKNYIRRNILMNCAILETANKLSGQYVNMAAFDALDDESVKYIEKSLKFYFKMIPPRAATAQQLNITGGLQ